MLGLLEVESKITAANMRVFITGYLAIKKVVDAIFEAMPEPEAESPEARAIASLQSFETQIEVVMRNYARQTPASAWALGYVPEFIAAGLVAGMPVDMKIEGAHSVIRICGMEPRRYISRAEAMEILGAITKRAKRNLTEEEQEELIRAARYRRDPLPPPPVSWDMAYMWLTKSNHSEFLRTICLRLGEWFSMNYSADAAKYRAVYRNTLERESQDHPGLLAAQVEHRAQNAAVRSFLVDYTTQLQKG